MKGYLGKTFASLNKSKYFASLTRYLRSDSFLIVKNLYNNMVFTDK